jgi:hypothetical protein
MADDLRADLDQLLAQARQRPWFRRLGQGRACACIRLIIYPLD